MKLDRAALYGGGAYLLARAFEGLFGGAIADAAKQAGWYDSYPRILTLIWAALSSTPATMLFAAVLGGAVAARLGRSAVSETMPPAPAAPDPDTQAVVKWQRTVGAALPARVAQIEPQVARHDSVLANQSLAIRYRRAETAVEAAVATIEEQMPECQAAFASKEVPKTSFQVLERTRRRQALRLVLQQLETDLATGLRAPVNLTAHPNYTLNPMRAVPGDGEIEDPEQRQEFRRVYDQATTALKLLRQLQGRISTARHAAERVTVDLTDTPLI